MNKMHKPALVITACLAALAPAFGAGPDIAAVARKVYPSVVRVEVRNHTRRVATGVAVEKGGYVVTTALVSPRDEKVIITTSEGKDFDAEFLGFDSETRLALLRAKGADLPVLAAAKSGGLAPGSWICVIGVSPERTAAVTQGIVSSVAEDKLRLNVWVTPGSSGGPVVDEEGRMVGLLRGIYMDERPIVFQFRDREQAGSGVVVNSQAQAPSSGMALAVPVAVVKDVAAQIKDKGRVERGWLGVGIGQDEDGRTVITNVDPDSPADRAKLEEGDIVLEIGGRAVAGPDVLAAEIRKRKPGQEVVLRLERDGRPLEVKAKLGEMAEDEAMKEMMARFPGLFAPGPETMFKARPGAPPAAPNAEAPGARTPQAPGWTFETRRFIGLWGSDLTPELAAHFGVKDGPAVVISKLTEDGPAARAKLRVGDVIVSADGKRIKSGDELIDLVQSKAKGETIKLEVLRDKKTLTVAVEVAEAKSGDPAVPEGLQEFLESWQGYTDALRRELQTWTGDKVQVSRRHAAFKGSQRRI